MLKLLTLINFHIIHILIYILLTVWNVKTANFNQLKEKATLNNSKLVVKPVDLFYIKI